MKAILAACAAAAVLAGCGAPVVGTEGPDPAAAAPDEPPSSEKSLVSFAILFPAVTGAVDRDTGTVRLVAPPGTDRSSLVAVFRHTGVMVSVDDTEQESGVTINDFTAPVSYIVEAEDGTGAEYVVTVELAPSAEKSITSFGFSDPAAGGVIDQDARIIRVRVLPGTDVTSRAAVFTTTGVSVSVNGVPQEPGVTRNDFTSPVPYVVHAEDGSVAYYEVRVAGTIGLVINELDADQPGTDTAEYVELFAGSPVDLAGLIVVFLNGSVSPGQEYARVDLAPAGCLPAGTCLLVAGPGVTAAPAAVKLSPPGWTLSNRIQNGPNDAVMIYDLIGHRVVDTVSYNGILHAALVAGEETAADATEGASGAPADSGSVPGSIGRSPEGLDTGRNDADFRFSATLTPGGPNAP